MKNYISNMEVLKAISHPVRIAILKELSKGAKSVSEFDSFFNEISQPNISQHLSKLRVINIIDYYIDGRQRFYFLKHPLALGILQLLEKKYNKKLPEPQFSLVDNDLSCLTKRKKNK